MEDLKQIRDSIDQRVAQDALALSTSLPEHVEQNISTIVALRTKAEQEITHHQRLIERITDFFGRPAFLLSLLYIVGLWMVFNLLPQNWNNLVFDPPPFDWLEKLISLGSLLMTAGVMVRQSRQEQLAEGRAQLSLQINLLTEQKVAKLIALIEELRKDLPDVENRNDPEAETMQQSADPHAVMDALEETLAQDLEQIHNKGSKENE
jgi:uncharacterized membrane protein